MLISKLIGIHFHCVCKKSAKDTCCPFYYPPDLVCCFQNKEIIQEKGVFYYVYQEIFTRSTCSCSRNDSACHTDGTLLFYGNTDPICCLRCGMDRLSLRDAARGFQDISIKSVSEREQQRLKSCENEKSVSSGCHP